MVWWLSSLRHRAPQPWALTQEARNENLKEGREGGRHKDEEGEEKEQRKRLDKRGGGRKGQSRDADRRNMGWHPSSVLTSCCAGAGAPGRGPWGSALGAGSGTGRGQECWGWPTWRLVESCGRQARSTAREHCCGRGACPQGACSPAPSWAPRYSCHRSPATPWEEKLRHSEGSQPTSTHACCPGETAALSHWAGFPGQI